MVMQDNDKFVLEERKIGFAGNVNFVPYYTNSSWNATDDAFYFFTMPCDDVTPTLCVYHVDTDTSERLFDLEFFTFEKGSVDLFPAVILPNRSLMIYGNDEMIAVADLKNGRQEIKITLEKRHIHGCCISPDERYLCYGVFDDYAVTDIHVVDTLNSEWKDVAVKTVDMHANHFQFFPNGDEILFAHEGTTEKIPDRLNWLNWKTGETRCLHRHAFDDQGRQIECIGHEQVAGNKVLAVRFPVSQMDFGIIVVDPKTGSCELVDQGDYWHASSDKNGERFVMDTMWWGNSRRRMPLFDITLFDMKERKRFVLKTFEAGSINNQMYHPHPHFDGTGKKILYSVHPKGTDECHLELLLIK